MGPHSEEVSPEQIRERMADTRAALAANLELLRARATPKALISHQLTGARKKLHGAGDRAARPLHKASSGARNASSGAIGAAEHTMERVGSPIRGVVGAARQQLADRPMLLGLGAVLLGAVTGVLLPGPRFDR